MCLFTLILLLPEEEAEKGRDNVNNVALEVFGLLGCDFEFSKENFEFILKYFKVPDI
jgi:hypothetical protein